MHLLAGDYLWWLLLAGLSYLSGSFPTAWVLGKALGGIDIRRHGSGNVGASNAARVLGRLPGLAVLLVDAGKGVLAVLGWGSLWATPWLTASAVLVDTGLAHDLARLAAGSLAILGHAFPVWLGWRGGKAVATGAAVASCLAPWAAPACLLVFGLALALGRWVSLASILAALCLPVAYALIYRGPDFSGAVEWFFVLVALLVLILHRANIKRLRAGTEPRFGAKAGA